MPATYDSIASVTLTGTQSTVEFTSISGSYTDLVLVATIIRASADTNAYIQFNGDTGSNYSATYVYGDGSSAASGRDTNFAGIRSGYVNTNPSVRIINIQNYANTTTNKTVITRSSTTAVNAMAIAGLWRSTAAITSVKFYLQDSNTFASGSTFTLYGIRAA